MSINLRTLLSNTVTAIKNKLNIDSFTWGEFDSKLEEAVNGADAFSKRLFEDPTIRIKFSEGQHKLTGESDAVADVDLVVPEGVEEIREKLFENVRDIESITLPNTLKIIRFAAFRYLYAAKPLQITFGNNLETIEEFAFAQCSMETLVFPDSLKRIENYAFQECSYRLKSVKMGSGINYIGAYAFQACSKLTEVDFSKCSAVPECGQNAFYQCSNDLTIKVPSALLSQWKAASDWSTYASSIVGV